MRVLFGPTTEYSIPTAASTGWLGLNTGRFPYNTSFVESTQPDDTISHDGLAVRHDKHYRLGYQQIFRGAHGGIEARGYVRALRK